MFAQAGDIFFRGDHHFINESGFDLLGKVELVGTSKADHLLAFRSCGFGVVRGIGHEEVYFLRNNALCKVFIEFFLIECAKLRKHLEICQMSVYCELDGSAAPGILECVDVVYILFVEVLCADDLVYSRLDIAVIHHHITVDLFTVYDYADDLAVLDNSLFHGRVEHYLTAELCECLAVCIGDSLAAAFGIARSSCGGFPAQAAHKFSGACFPVRQAGVNCANHPDA